MKKVMKSKIFFSAFLLTISIVDIVIAIVDFKKSDTAFAILLILMGVVIAITAIKPFLNKG